MNIKEIIQGQSCGSDNYLSTGFVEIPSSPYVVFNPSNALGRAYPHWSIVFSLLRGNDGKLPFSVIQVSNKETQLLNGAIDARGLAPNQVSTLVNNAQLTISVESFLPHYCHDNKLPFAGFYGFARKENFGVYDSHFCWNLTSKQHSSPVDAQKEMDGYSPFTISEVIKFAMGQVSGVNRNKYPVQEYIGDKRINPSIVVFPDFAPPANFLNGFSFDLRLDKVTTSQYLLDWCRGRKINLFSPKVLRPEIVKQLSQFLIQLQIADDDNLTEECLHFVKSLNINPVVIAAKDRLSKLRNKFFDFSVIEEPQDQLLPDFDSGKFISSQAVMKGGKVYPSIGAAEAEVGGESLGNWSTDWFYQFKPLTKEVLTASRKEVSHFYIIKP